MSRRCIVLMVGASIVAAVACGTPDGPTAPGSAIPAETSRQPEQARIGLNVFLDRAPDARILEELGAYGRVTGGIDEIHAVFLLGSQGALPAIRNLPYVTAAGRDARRTAGPPVTPVALSDLAGGLGTWDLDAVGVTDLGEPAVRTVDFDGTGVYVGVLDTGLMSSWRAYFPADRIATDLARSFGGGGAMGGGVVSTQPNKWERDTQGHGTHVTSTILGYALGATPVNGVAPRATVIPVKVLNNSGLGWSSVIARGIVYMTRLEEGALGGAPVVINLSLGGARLDPVEKAAVDYAVDHGVIVVAAAGNEGLEGMTYPGAYQPVISVGASGWTGEWTSGSWWYAQDVADPTAAGDFYVEPFSGRALPGQDLDVLAPGSWILGPYQVDQGHLAYYFLGGTSMATPHVAGIVALLAQKDPDLTAMGAEALLESTAHSLPPGERAVRGPDGTLRTVSWAADATGSGLVDAAAALAPSTSP